MAFYSRVHAPEVEGQNVKIKNIFKQDFLIFQDEINVDR